MRTQTQRASDRSGLLAAAAATAVALGACLLPMAATAQQDGTSGASPAQRAGEVVSMLELAVTEYADAVADGEVVNAAEYEESRQFMAEAGRLFRGLREDAETDVAPAVAARIDSLSRIVERKGAVEDFRQVADRAKGALAEGWGAVSLPEPARAPSVARGAGIYRRRCASCHGVTGEGDGPEAEGLEPPAADLTAEVRHTDITPARDYQVVTLGIPATSMAGFSAELDAQQRWDVVAYLQTLRFRGDQVAEGKALALGSGEGKSPVSGRVRQWAEPVAGARLTDRELARRIRARWNAGAAEGAPAADGSPGSASEGDAPETAAAASGDDGLPAILTEGQARSVVAYVRTLMGTPATGVPEPDPSAALVTRVEEADSLAVAAAALSREGRTGEARSTALRAYMAFEGVEPDLRARAPELMTDIETAFGDFRSAAVAGTPDAELARVQDLLDRAETELEGAGSAWAVATQSFFIILREGFEAILIIGAILAFLMKTGHEERKRDVYWGVGSALVASGATYVVLESVLSVTPASRELLEGVTMLVAVAVLFSVSYWLVSKLEQEKWEEYLRGKMKKALGAGGGLALAGVAFLAVYREGFETVLFYKALFGFSEAGLAPVGGGFLVGCAALAVIYVLFTRFGMKVPMRPFFAITSAVLYYMAIVFAGSGIHELQEAGVVGFTPLAGAPRLPLLGVYPTVETLVAQGVMAALLLGGLALTFGPSLLRRRSGGRTESAAGA